MLGRQDEDTLRRKAWLFLEGSWPFGRLFGWFIIALVICNVVLMVVTTVDSIYEPRKTAFDTVEGVTVALFTMEYLLRLYACVEDVKLQPLGPLLGRLRHIFSLMSIVDLVAILPYYVLLLVQLNQKQGNNQIGFFGAIRALRIFRLLKAERVTSAFYFIQASLLEVGDLMAITMAIEIIFFLFLATMLYLIEPQHYTSIPDAM
jgi:voltage-gated potassium channel